MEGPGEQHVGVWPGDTWYQHQDKPSGVLHARQVRGAVDGEMGAVSLSASFHAAAADHEQGPCLCPCWCQALHT